MKIFDCVGCGRFETYRSAIGSDGEKCCAFNMLSLSTAKHTTHTYVYFRTSISIFDGELWRTGRRKRNQKANTQFDISFAGTYQLLALYVTTVALFAAFFFRRVTPTIRWRKYRFWYTFTFIMVVIIDVHPIQANWMDWISVESVTQKSSC